MLWLAVLVSIGGMVLAAWAIRGRVVARGVFCRTCRFDLAGLDRAKPETACPECGTRSSLDHRVRKTVRAPRRWVAALGTLVVVCGVFIAVFGTGMTAMGVLRALPNWAVGTAEKMGIDDAMTVLADRALADEFSEREWIAMIQRALLHQSDAATPWDPRWGDVLVRAIRDGRLDTEQLTQFFETGLITTITIRNEIGSSDREIPFAVTWSRNRMSARLPPQLTTWQDHETGLWVKFEIRRSGMVGLYEPPDREGNSSGTPFHASRADGPGGTMMTGIPISRIQNSELIQEMDAFVEIAIAVSDGHDMPRLLEIRPNRHVERVQRLAPGQPVIAVVQDPQAAEQVGSSIQLSNLRITPIDQHIQGQRLASVRLRIRGNAHAFGGMLFLVTPAGEWRIGSVASEPGKISDLSMGVSGYNVDLDEWERTIAPIIASGQADFEFRTDVAPAERNPMIDEVVDLTLQFTGVPVQLDGAWTSDVWHDPTSVVGTEE